MSIGTNPQVVSAKPYDASYYLDPTNGACCIDKGTDIAGLSAKDFLGQNRVFNDIVDIGAIEFSKVVIVPSFLVSPQTGVGPTDVELTAVMQGASLKDCTFAWYTNGSTTAFSTAAVVTNRFDVGKHSVKLVVTYGGTEYPTEEKANAVTIYTPDIYLNTTSKDPVWPYRDAATAATNITDAKSAFVSGVTLHVAAGNYHFPARLDLGPNMRIEGEGADRTVFYAKNAAGSDATCSLLYMNGSGAYAEGIALSNTYSATGLLIEGSGGHFTQGKITHCVGIINQEGGGAKLICSDAKISRSLVCYNKTYQVIYSSCSGGGLYMTGGAVAEDCLILGNAASLGGGAYVNASTLRNCTVVGNSVGDGTPHSSASGVSYGGGVYTGYSAGIANCIIYGNVDKASDATAETSNYCGVAAVPTTTCCLRDPRFVDSAHGDYRIQPDSPCRYAGTYQSWMKTATDYFGNPRWVGSPRRPKVDIGFHQLPSKGLSILVR